MVTSMMYFCLLLYSVAFCLDVLNWALRLLGFGIAISGHMAGVMQIKIDLEGSSVICIKNRLVIR